MERKGNKKEEMMRMRERQRVRNDVREEDQREDSNPIFTLAGGEKKGGVWVKPGNPTQDGG